MNKEKETEKLTKVIMDTDPDYLSEDYDFCHTLAVKLYEAGYLPVEEAKSDEELLEAIYHSLKIGEWKLARDMLKELLATIDKQGKLYKEG